MKSIKFLPQALILILLLLLPRELKSQTRWKPWINAGYVTNFKKNPDNLKADAGGSIRIGLLNKGVFDQGRFGLYAGFLWFKEYAPDPGSYYDKGRVLMAGIDYLLLKKGNFHWSRMAMHRQYNPVLPHHKE